MKKSLNLLYLCTALSFGSVASADELVKVIEAPKNINSAQVELGKKLFFE